MKSNLKPEVVEQLDATKLHNEINQIKNQRFLLTTSAIALFGVASGWLNNRTDSNSYSFVTFATISLYVLLFLFFIYSNSLKETLLTISVYLIVSGNSKWEKHYLIFYHQIRNKIIPNFSFLQSIIYFFLGCAVFFYPFIFLKNFFCFSIYFIVHLIISTLYFFFVIRAHRLTNKNFSKDKLVQMWKQILETPDDSNNNIIV